MNFRRPRTHQTGASNLIAKFSYPSAKYSTSRTEASEIEDQLYPARHSVDTAKGKRDGYILSKRTLTNLSPLDRTQQFYYESGKPLRTKTQLSVPRTAHLEEKDKRKMAFTGESTLLFDKRLEKYREEDTSNNLSSLLVSGSSKTCSKTFSNEFTIEKDHLIKEKRDLNGKAIQETQLVGYDKYSADTLKNNVNLEKVREAKRILRRRYAHRNKLQKIYAAWDEENSGTISLDNVYNMSKKLGLNLNFDEARVLLASANKSGTGTLSLDEFLDLIYNKDDALNVDLDKLSKNMDANYLLQREELFKDDGNDGILKKLELDAKKKRENKRMNQVNLVLKNKLNQLALNLLAGDPNKLGYINYETFEDKIKQLGINETVVSTNDIKNLAKKFDKNQNIDYKGFVEYIRNFKVHFEDIYAEHKQPSKKTNSLILPQVGPTEEEFHIVDCREVPYNVMVSYLEKRGKVNTAIKRYFPTENEFKEYLSKSLSIGIDKLAEHPVSKVELKGVIDKLFDNFDDSGLRKRDYEGFCSSFLYNKHGYTNLKDLCQGIYSENDREYFEKIIFKKLGIPPHDQISGVKRKSVPAVSKESEDKLDKLELEAVKAPRASVNDNKMFTSGLEMDKELKEILQKVDDKILVGTKKNFDVYKLFDLDKDGFISHNDLTNKIEEFAVLSLEEIPKLLNYLDPENKGYVNFKEFHSKIRPNMVQEDENGQPIVLPIVMPSKKYNQKEVPNFEQYKKKVEDVTKTFECTHTLFPVPKTRYGATPVWTNTFLNFQPSSNSGMFASEAQRFANNPSHRLNPQREEQAKKTMKFLSRLAVIKANQMHLQNKVEQNYTREQTLNDMKLKKKEMATSFFERNAKLKNNFAFCSSGKASYSYRMTQIYLNSSRSKE